MPILRLLLNTIGLNNNNNIGMTHMSWPLLLLEALVDAGQVTLALVQVPVPGIEAVSLVNLLGTPEVIVNVVVNQGCKRIIF